MIWADFTTIYTERMNLRDFVDAKSRRDGLAGHLGIELPNIGNFSLDEKQASTKNCENMIGAIQVPVGIAGSLKIKNPAFAKGYGEAKQNSHIKEYYIPLATTEGALVASVNRGCSAITKAGGVTVISEKAGITRAPVFEVENITAGKELAAWVEKNSAKLKEITESTSHHMKLIKIEPFLMGRNVFLRFSFDTEDAMGMNMATIAVAKAVPYIEEETKAKCIALSGNMCADKKPNYLNFIEGRGYKVWADAVLPEEIVKSVLKTTTDAIVEVGRRKLLYGSIMSGSIGANAQIANIISAIFIATGQDAAHVSECSMGVTTVEKVKEGLYASIYLPDLVIGTVGGGTQLATQKEALKIMGMDTKGSTKKCANCGCDGFI